MLQKAKWLTQITEGGVIAVIRRVPADMIEAIAESLVEGGVTALEITMDTSQALPLIERISKKVKDKAVVGAGTVLDRESALLAIRSGAQFIFTPSLNQEVIQTSLRYGRVVVPGVMTPTEIITALEWGADMVKIFPASHMGPGYIKDINGPFPHVPMIPTGGVDLSNVAEFIRSGAAAVGIGGNLVNMQAAISGDFEQIKETAGRYVSAIKAARAEKSILA